MEGIQTIQALKAVQSSLPAQTTIPSDELVMLYAADGTPIAKIARDDLVKAVASVMASNSQNTFSKLLGVQANGTPMGIGASDLASVLGGTNSFRAAVNTATRYIRVGGNSGTIDTEYSFNDINSTWGKTLIVLVSGSNDYGLYLIGGYSGHIDVTSLKAHSSLTSFSLDNNNHLNVTVSGTIVVGIYDNGF